jgi:hypothetical protein
MFAAGSVLPEGNPWIIAGGLDALLGVRVGYAVTLGLSQWLPLISSGFGVTSRS